MALPMDKEADTERAIQNMRVLAKVAEEYDVTLGMEVLNRYEDICSIPARKRCACGRCGKHSCQSHAGYLPHEH